MNFPHLFSEGRIGGLTLKNRIALSAMGTRLNDDDGRVTDRDIAFHERRAAGGVGLVITGAAAVNDTSMGKGKGLTAAYERFLIPSISARAEAIHRHGARVFGQLYHRGREDGNGSFLHPPLAPSAVPSSRNIFMPRAMNLDEIGAVTGWFADSAAILQEAGVDGVEVHGAHGYLLSLFLSRATNVRIDAYGTQSVDNRIRFVAEVVEAIRLRCGRDFVVGVRLSAREDLPNGLTVDETTQIVERLQATQPVDYVSITEGVRGDYVKDSSVPEGVAVAAAGQIRRATGATVIVAQRIRYPATAEQALADGNADFVAMARAIVADPDWARKAAAQLPGDIRPCIGIVQDCRISTGGLTCAVNAFAGREHEWSDVGARPVRPARILVVGGGPGGLEAARVAADRGHQVQLREREAELGGQLRAAAKGPTRGELADYIRYQERELSRLGVDVQTGVEVTAELVGQRDPELVVIATGARADQPWFPVDAGSHVVDVVALLSEPATGGRACVIDDGVGFWPAISAAEYLADAGARVSLLTSARAIAGAIPHESVANVCLRLSRKKVELLTSVQVLEVADDVVHYRNSYTSDTAALPADLCVVSSRRVPNAELATALVGTGRALTRIGDCGSPRRLTHAVLDANVAIQRFEERRLSDRDVVLF